MTDKDKIRDLMLQGFEAAFVAQIGNLFKVYTTNVVSVQDQHIYTKKGIENAVSAYRLAVKAVNEWDG
jgi:hypothetical protein